MSAVTILNSPTTVVTDKPVPKRARTGMLSSEEEQHFLLQQRNHQSTVEDRAVPQAVVVVRLEDFYQLPAPHPYGVLPGGNRFLTSSSSTRTGTGTATTTTPTLTADLLLTEECWNAVLALLDGPDLGRLAQTCRFLYVAAHQPEFWRDLVLQSRRDRVIDRMGPSWKDTYVLLLLEHHHRPEEAQQNSDDDAPPPPPPAHQPMAVPGIYSDYYYRLHACRSFALPVVWLNGSDDGCPWSVPKIPVAEMTTARFVSDYERPNRPVVIQGAAQSWATHRKWTSEYFQQQIQQQQTFRATSGVASQPAQFTWQAYQQYCNHHSTSMLEEGPLYLFDRTALQPGSPLWHDYMPDLQRTCPYWDPAAASDETNQPAHQHHHHDLLQLLGEGRRPDHTWLIAGPPRSGSVFHLDPNATHAWNATLVGAKRWIFYPPGGAPPPGVHPSPDGDQVALPWTVGEWILQFWTQHCQRKHAGGTAAAASQARPLEVTAMPGDVVFVPHGWWHMVVNLDHDPKDHHHNNSNNSGCSSTMNIAITHNYVSTSNLGNVLKFFDRHRDQVSGCRDRPESIKPETLYEEFVAALQREHPQPLEAALAERAWTCPAWKKGLPTANNQDDDEDGENQITKSTTTTTKETKSRVLAPPLNVMDKAKSGGHIFSFSFV